MPDPTDLSSFLRPSANQTLPPQALIPEVYKGAITRWETGMTATNNTPFVRFAISLLDWSPRIPEEAKFQDAPDGTKVPIDLSRRQLRKDFFLTPNAYYRLENFLIDMGETINIDADGNKDYETPINNLKGAVVGVEVQRIQARTSGEFINVVGELMPWKQS